MLRVNEYKIICIIFLKIINVDRFILTIKVFKLPYYLPNPLSYEPIILSIQC